VSCVVVTVVSLLKWSRRANSSIRPVSELKNAIFLVYVELDDRRHPMLLGDPFVQRRAKCRSYILSSSRCMQVNDPHRQEGQE
jgi:hypothetical protein